MKKLSYIAIGLVSVAAIGVSTVGLVSADSTDSTSTVGTSGIPRSVFKEERLDAASQVLNTTTATIQTAHKDRTFSQLISKAGLIRETYREKLKTQLTTDLEAKGYSQDQITIALQHRHIVHLRHRKNS